jgi:hypothetical protein
MYWSHLAEERYWSKVRGTMQVMGRRGRRFKKLMHDLKEKRR